jgi:hypothetical protein
MMATTPRVTRSSIDSLTTVCPVVSAPARITVSSLEPSRRSWVANVLTPTAARPKKMSTARDCTGPQDPSNSAIATMGPSSPNAP